MGLAFELVWWLFADVIVRWTGHGVLYLLTLGRRHPGEDDEWPPYVAGGLFWLAVVVGVFVLTRR